MRLALGLNHVTEDNLTFARQIGATDIVAAAPQEAISPEGPFYDYERLVQLRTRIEAAGLRLAAIQNVPATWYDRIRYGLPGREEQLDRYCTTLVNLGKAGVPILGYNFHAVKVWRTSRHTRDRGGALVTSYDHALMGDAPLVGPKPIDDDELWANYEHFITRVIPVAESVGLKMALHPDDPPVSPIAGAACLFRDTGAFQRALDMVPSPSNGILFCQGCFTEMYGQGVFDAIRHFGRQGKVFYVHFRNVVGTAPRFREAFLDSGDIDMWQAMQVWKEVGFDGPMIPDHYAHIVGDSDEAHRSQAHAIGYMKALMQAAGALN
jgi:mannonate dehydratase